MTQEQRAALREAASKATPYWEVTQIGVWHDKNAAAPVGDFVALAHPAAVLALLDECERLKWLLRRAVEADDGFALPQDLFDEARAALEPVA